MATKASFTFAPERDYDNWHDYFAAYAEHRELIRNPPVPEAKDGDVRTVGLIHTVPEDDMPRSARTLRNYAQDWDFDCQVLTHSRERYFRGQWVHEDVLHVTGVHDAYTHSAFHMRWVNGKAQDCRIQINGGPVEWLGITAAKKRMQEAV